MSINTAMFSGDRDGQEADTSSSISEPLCLSSSAKGKLLWPAIAKHRSRTALVETRRAFYLVWRWQRPEEMAVYAARVCDCLTPNSCAKKQTLLACLRASSS